MCSEDKIFIKKLCGMFHLKSLLGKCCDRLSTKVEKVLHLHHCYAQRETIAKDRVEKVKHSYLRNNP